MHNEVWAYTEILPLTVPYTSAKLRLHSLVFVVSFWNEFGKSIESWNNRCILGYIWIASIVRVMREWFPFPSSK